MLCAARAVEGANSFRVFRVCTLALWLNPVHPQVVGYFGGRRVGAPGLQQRAHAAVGPVPSPGVPRSNRQLGDAPGLKAVTGSRCLRSVGHGASPGCRRARTSGPLGGFGTPEGRARRCLPGNSALPSGPEGHTRRLRLQLTTWEWAHLGFLQGCFQPGRATENSPAFQRWDYRPGVLKSR